MGCITYLVWLWWCSRLTLKVRKVWRSRWKRTDNTMMLSISYSQNWTVGFYENDFIVSNVLDIISRKVTEIFSVHAECSQKSECNIPLIFALVQDHIKPWGYIHAHYGPFNGVKFLTTENLCYLPWYNI
jgi:hypothetical protein